MIKSINIVLIINCYNNSITKKISDILEKVIFILDVFLFPVALIIAPNFLRYFVLKLAGFAIPLILN